MNVRIGVPGPDGLRRITESICTHLHLNCTLVPYPDFKYGDIDEFGHGDGMIGEVQRNHYDTFQPVFTPTYSRFREMDFSEPYFYSDIVFVTRSSSPDDHEGEGFNLSLVMAFRWQTWLGFIGALVLTSGFISTATRWISDGLDEEEYVTTHQYAKPRTSGSEGSIVGWLLALVDPLPSLIHHKYKNRYLKYHFVRVMIAFWSLGIVVLSCAYTGLLFSAKIKSSISLPYKDLETFVQCLVMDKCGIIAETTSASQIWTLYRYEGVHEALERRPIIVEELDLIPDAILAEKNIHMVWIADRLFYDVYTKNNTDCKYYAIEGFKEAWTFPLRKNSTELKTILNRGAAAFQESGLYRAEFLDHRKDDEGCLHQGGSLIRRSIPDETFAPIFRTPFYFLALGIGLALVAFLGEMCFRRWRRSRVVRYE